MESLKGIDFLLQEIQSLPRDKYELFIAGEGDTALSTKEFKQREYPGCASVHWLGFIQSAELFQKIDLLVVPSIWQEPFGRVIVEAYSAGIPVLASRVGGIPEIVRENVTGFLFDPHTPGSFPAESSAASRVGGAIRSMRPACLEKKREFDPDSIGRQYLDLFERVRQLPRLAPGRTIDFAYPYMGVYASRCRSTMFLKNASDEHLSRAGAEEGIVLIFNKNILCLFRGDLPSRRKPNSSKLFTPLLYRALGAGRGGLLPG